MRAITQDAFVQHLFKFPGHHKDTLVRLRPFNRHDPAYNLPPNTGECFDFAFDRLEFGNDDDSNMNMPGSISPDSSGQGNNNNTITNNTAAATSGSGGTTASTPMLLKPRAVWKLQSPASSSSSTSTSPGELDRERLEACKRHWHLQPTEKDLLDNFLGVYLREQDKVILRKHGRRPFRNIKLGGFPVMMQFVDPKVDRNREEVSFLWCESLNRFYAKTLRQGFARWREPRGNW